MDFELISFKLCPFVQRAAIILLFKEIPYRTTYVDLADPPDWFRALSPFGKVPVLRLDGTTVLFESPVINEYLDEVTPGRLLPEDPLERALARGWIEFTTACLWHCRDFSLAADGEALAREVGRLEDKLERLEAVKASGPFFLGESFSLVDGAAAPLFVRLAYFQNLFPVMGAARFPKLAAWGETLRALPAVARSVIPDFAAEMDALMRRRKGHLAALLGGGGDGPASVY